MDVLKLFRSSPPPQKAIDVIPQIPRRSERLDAEAQVKTFVSIGGVEKALLNTDNRVVFGRRGTGKTHILSYVSDKVQKNAEICLTIDLRFMGSNSYLYVDDTLSLAEKTNYLIRDVVTAIHDGLMEIATSPTNKLGKKLSAKYIDELGDTISEIAVRDSYERESTVALTDKDAIASEISAKLTPMDLNVSGKVGANLEHSGTTGTKSVEKGHYRISINAGGVGRTLSSVISHSQTRLWLLLDEWSAIPEPLQPFLADFLKRSILPISQCTIVIAAIEQRTNFRFQQGGNWIGVELGSDMFADINLDDYLVFENDPDISIDFFKKMIFSHLEQISENGLEEKTPDEFVSKVFTQGPTFKELVRASEGVPRDAINILQLAALRANGKTISIPDIRNAARDWYDRDKASFVNGNKEAHEFLAWLIDNTIARRKARAFLLRTDIKDPLLDRLFDERVLHIAKRSYSGKDEPGIRYKVWKLDYGCYVDRINTSAAPTGFLLEHQDKEEGSFYVPEDDFRSIRRAILDLSAFKANTAAAETDLIDKAASGLGMT